MSQPSTPSPLEKLQADIRTAQNNLNSLQGRVRMADLRDQVEDIQTAVQTLETQVRDLRTKGYAFEKGMEAKAKSLQDQWAPLQPVVINLINDHSTRLDMEVRSIESLMMQLTSRSGNIAQATPFLNQVQSAISSMESKVQSVENAIRGSYDDLNQAVSKMTAHIKQVSEMLDWFSQATFRLHEAEAPVNAVKAVWAPNGKEEKDDPQGYLFLSDQRVFFEQNEEIATKKILFITTEKQKVQKLLFEFPVVLVEDVTTAKLGLFKNEDHLDLKLTSGAPFPSCHFHIFNQPCEEWDALFGRVKSKELDADRVTAISQEVIEKVKKAPAQCPSCGGVISKPVLRGQDTITCDFCGLVIRL